MDISFLLDGNNLSRLLYGLWITVKISFISVFFSAVFGTVLGVLMTSRLASIRFICRSYLEVVRVMPLLVLLFISYFGLAKWFNLHLSAVYVCIAVFIFWGSAEMGDLVRGALTSIEKHQLESAKALALNNQQIFISILFPQSLKRVTPGAINLFTRMIKTSSLAMLIGVLEIIKVGQQIIENSLLTAPSASFWIYGFIMLCYFLICYPLSLLAHYLEKTWDNA